MVEASDLTEAERESIDEVEAGVEWIHRAHGALLELHHAVGHGMEHFDAAAEALSDEHPELAERFESAVLPAGLTEEGHLSYQLVAEFEETFLDPVEDAVESTREEVVDGERYVVEAARHAEAGVEGKASSAAGSGSDGSSGDDGGEA